MSRDRWDGFVAGRCGWRAVELLADFNHGFLQASGVGPVDERCEGTLQPRAMVSHHRLVSTLVSQGCVFTPVLLQQRLRGLPDPSGSGSAAAGWAAEGWTEGEAWKGLLAYTCHGLPSPAEDDSDEDGDDGDDHQQDGGGEENQEDQEGLEAWLGATPLSAAGRWWLELPLLIHSLRQPTGGGWGDCALHRLGLALSVLGGDCDRLMTALLAGLCFYSGGLLRAGVSGAVPLSVREAGGARSALLLRLGQALLQFMSRSPAEDIRNTAGTYAPMFWFRLPKSFSAGGKAKRVFGLQVGFSAALWRSATPPHGNPQR